MCNRIIVNVKARRRRVYLALFFFFRLCRCNVCRFVVGYRVWSVGMDRNVPDVRAAPERIFDLLGGALVCCRGDGSGMIKFRRRSFAE